MTCTFPAQLWRLAGRLLNPNQSGAALHQAYQARFLSIAEASARLCQRKQAVLELLRCQRMSLHSVASVHLHLCFLLGLSFACTPAQTREVAVPNVEPLASSGPSARVLIQPTVVTPHQSFGVEEAFEQGMRAYEEAQYAEAVKLFDKIITLAPETVHAPEALYFSALAVEEQGDHRQAAVRFERVARQFPSSARATEASTRALRLWLFLEQWQRAGALSEAYLTQLAGLSSRGKLVLFSARALALLDRAELESAEYYISKARGVIDAEQLDSAGTIPRDLAQVYYAQGELRRLRGEAIHFTPLPDNFADVFEQRAQLLLDAQAAYSDAMRAYDAHWSAMSGYRVGQLYERLHDEVVAMPRPSEVKSGKQARLFEGAFRLRYSILLKKGLRMFEHTLQMAERTGESSVWVEKTRSAKARVEVALAEEQKLLNRLPYTRAELEAVLREMQAAQH